MIRKYSYIYLANYSKVHILFIRIGSGMLGILRLKSWSNCLFMKSDYILSLKSVLNARGLECKVGDPSKIFASQHTQDAVIEALLAPQVKSTVESSLGCQKVDLPTPPSTPSQSPPKFEIPLNQSPSDFQHFFFLSIWFGKYWNNYPLSGSVKRSFASRYISTGYIQKDTFQCWDNYYN